jgi:exopolysaccharide biosynthesis WecB/TagA/CpsF family protein
MKSVLILATGHQTKGGITSVMQYYKQSSIWENWNCTWLETHVDKSKVEKVWVFIKAFVQYFFLLPKNDIVHVHLSEPPSAFRKLLFIYPAKWFGKKCIVHLHSFSPETSFNSKYQWVYKKVFFAADEIIVLSPFWKQSLEKTFGNKISISIVLNPSSVPEIVEQYQRKQILLFAGTLNSRKGYKDLIKSFALIHEQFPNWKLYLAGNGEIDEAEELALSLGVGEKTFCVGWVEKLLKQKLFSEASIFCLPSYAEGFPMAVIDAMGYKIPVITTTVGGITDIFTSGEDILLYNPGDINQLLLHIANLMNSKTERLALCNKAYEKIESEFSIEKIATQLDEIYTKVLNPPVNKEIAFEKVLGYTVFSDSLEKIPIQSDYVRVVNTISPNSYGLALRNTVFENALKASDYLVLDGVYFALASIFMNGRNIKKNQGPDVFDHYMHQLNKERGTAFFLGSTNKTLRAIKKKAAADFPNVQIHSYSPPFKAVFSKEDDALMCDRVNAVNPDILFIGMTCPKQECWSIKNKHSLNVKLIISIGNVFDWYAGTQKSVHPVWFKLRLGWLARIFVRPEIFSRNIGNQMLFFKDTFQQILFKKKKEDYSLR